MIDGTMAAFADDVTFEFNGSGTGLPGMTGPIKRKPSVRNAIQNLINNLHFGVAPQAAANPMERSQCQSARNLTRSN